MTIRKIVRHVDETYRENGRDLGRPYRVAVLAVIIENPFPLEYADDLVSTADEAAAELGSLMAPAVVELLGTEVEAFGKGALVGFGGEVEHGSALIHNMGFGNPFREAAQGTELLPAAEKRGLAGATMDIPLKHKLEARTRSHHQTFTFQVPDAPAEGEILIALAAADGGRPLARLAPLAAADVEVDQTP
ncbi:MAG: amino acid synthesis family protein [Actinobacteria bacterium]|nr:amino acid synthesis family protein [Actinomycetota bacterium]